MKNKHFKKYGWLYVLFGLVVLLLLILCLITNFNPFSWIAKHISDVINFSVLLILAGVLIFALWLKLRKRGV